MSILSLNKQLVQIKKEKEIIKKSVYLNKSLLADAECCSCEPTVDVLDISKSSDSATDLARLNCFLRFLRKLDLRFFLCVSYFYA